MVKAESERCGKRGIGERDEEELREEERANVLVMAEEKTEGEKTRDMEMRGRFL